VSYGVFGVNGAVRGTCRRDEGKLKVRDMWDLEIIKDGRAGETRVEQEEQNEPFSTTSTLENNEFY
jgi:hypothetical protein